MCLVISTFAFTNDFPFNGKHIFQPSTRQTSRIGFGIAWLVGCVDGFVFLHGTCVGHVLVLATLNIQVPKLEEQPVLQQTALHQAVYQNKSAALLQSETKGRLPDSSCRPHGSDHHAFTGDHAHRPPAPAAPALATHAGAVRR